MSTPLNLHTCRPRSGMTVAEITGETNLLQGYGAIYLRLENFLPGTIFNLDGKKFMIGQTGQYELYIEDPVYNLYIPQVEIDKNINNNQEPMVTFGIQTGLLYDFSMFDITYGITNNRWQFMHLSSNGGNVLEPYFDIKHNIKSVFFAQLYSKDLVDLNISFEALCKYVYDANSVYRRNYTSETEDPQTGMTKYVWDIPLDIKNVYRVPYNLKIKSFLALQNALVDYEGDSIDEIINIIRNQAMTDSIAAGFSLSRDNIKQYKQIIFPARIIQESDIVDDYIYCQIIDDGNQYKINIDTEYSTIAEYGANNFIDTFHKPVVTIKDMEIPVDENGKPYIKLGNAVEMNIGFYQQVYTYAMEQDINTITFDYRSEFLAAQSQYEASYAAWVGTADGITANEQYSNSAVCRYFNNEIDDITFNRLKNDYESARTTYMRVLADEIERKKEAASDVH